MTLASDLIFEVSNDLNDQWEGDEYSRWSRDDLLSYLNDAEQMTVFLKPQAFVVTAVYQLSQGIRQNLPDGSASFPAPDESIHPQAIELVSIIRNMGVAGLTEGSIIYPVDPKDFDDAVPGWRSATASATVQHTMFRANDRTKFEVYPPQPASPGWVEAVFSAVPHKIEKDGEDYGVPINLGSDYGPALRTYMLFRAYSRDAQNSEAALLRASNLWAQYLSLIGRKDLIESGLPTQRGSQHASSNPAVQR